MTMAGRGQEGPADDVFIRGEVVDLCAPSREERVLQQWYRWFNDPDVTPYLYQGVFPNTRERQERFYDTVTNSDNRIVLLIKPKSANYFVGVASLSFIDHVQRRCHFAMVIGKKDDAPDSIYYAMETKCRMTEHAFEQVGVERVQSEQVVELIKWQRWQVLFGYQIEGILRNNFRKGHRVWDTMMASCLLEDYLRLKEARSGSLWPGKSALFEMLKNLPAESTVDRLRAWLAAEQAENLWGMLKRGE
ncbi:MAG: GNAT family protein [Thermodesulfobacteriota bacterium]